MLAISGQRIAVLLWGNGATAKGDGSRIAYGSVDEFRAQRPSLLDGTMAEFGHYVLAVRFNDQIMTIEAGLGTAVSVWDFGPGRPQRIPKPPNVTLDTSTFVVGPRVMWYREGTSPRQSLSLRHSDAVVETLYSAPDLRFSGERTDGTVIVWQEYLRDSDSASRLAIRKSSWVSRASDFRPEILRDNLVLSNQFAAASLGEGWYVYRQDDATVRLVRVSDGVYLEAKAPTGFGFSEVQGVVGGEVWASLHALPGAYRGYTLMRVPVSSLGVPKP